MKAIFSLMLALTVSAASFATQPASSEPTAHLTLATANKVRLFVGQEDAKASISLWDAAGHQLYFERVNLEKGAFHQSFDVSNLTEGTYQFVITTGEATVTKTMVVDTKPAQRTVEVKS